MSPVHRHRVPGIVLVVLGLLVVVIAGCTGLSAGPGGPATAGPVPPPPVVAEEPADWADTALDPCRLLERTTTLLPGQIFTGAPHSCAVDQTATGGVSGRTIVRVGARFTTHDRAQADPVTVGGLSAYQTVTLPKGVDRVRTCTVDFPVSPTRSVQVDSFLGGQDVTTGCAVTRRLAGPVAAALSAPTEMARTSSALSVDRWTACGLAQAALGYQPREGLAGNTADKCETIPPGADPDGGAKQPILEIGLSAGPGTPKPEFPGDQLVPIGSRTAMLQDLGARCTLVIPLDPLAGNPADLAFRTLTLTQRNTPANCDGARAAEAAIQRTLARQAPAAPPAPAQLGFASGLPDDLMPAPCGIYGNTEPDTCRAPRPAPAPGTLADQLALQTTDPQSGADTACDMLVGAVRDVAPGAVETAALSDGSCIALGDGVSFTLGFFADAPPSRYCGTSRGGRTEVTVAGHPALRCGSNGATVSLYLPVGGADLEQPGTAILETSLRNPRGFDDLDQPRDTQRIDELATNAAEALAAAHLGA